jgi:hypothetical protein
MTFGGVTVVAAIPTLTFFPTSRLSIIAEPGCHYIVTHYMRSTGEVVEAGNTRFVKQEAVFKVYDARTRQVKATDVSD